MGLGIGGDEIGTAQAVGPVKPMADDWSQWMLPLAEMASTK
jgi:hypothetical protein